MQTKLISKESVSANFEVTISASDVDTTYQRVFSSLSRQVKVPGFRPGKAPKGVLLKRVGQEALNEEVKEALVNANYPKAVQELDLNPVHANISKADDPVEGSDYTFEVTVDLYPEFDLADLDEIIIDTEAQTISDDMVQESIEQLRNENATHIPVERAIEANDYIMIETIRDDEEEGEGSAMPIDLERTGEHLAAQLIGKTIDDVIELDLSGGETAEEDDELEASSEASDEDADDDAEEKAEAAELPTLKVRIKDVKEKEKPEADDELAKTLGLETWAEVEDVIRKNLQTEQDNQAFDNQREEFIDKLVEGTDLDLPAHLVNRRKVNLIENLAEDLKKQADTGLDAYFKKLEEDGKREEFDQELQESAEQGVKRDLVLEKLLEDRGTSMSDKEFNDAISYMAYREGSQASKFKKDMGERWLENYRFLLTRDKAIREVVNEKLGLNDSSDTEEIAETIAEEVPVEESTEENND